MMVLIQEDNPNSILSNTLGLVVGDEQDRLSCPGMLYVELVDFGGKIYVPTGSVRLIPPASPL